MQAVVIRVTSATTLMYSHGRGARGAVAGLDIGRRVVTHVAQTGKPKRLPMRIPLIIHILPYRPTPPILASAIQRLRVLPHPLSSSLCDQLSFSQRLPPQSSTHEFVGQPHVVQTLPQVVQMMPQVGQGGGARSSSDAPRSPRGAPSNSRAAPGSLREAPSSSMGMKMIGGMMMLAISSWLKPQAPLVARPLVPRHTQLHFTHGNGV